jgi:hypothetical protein
VPYLQRLAQAPIGHSVHERIPGLVRDLDAEEYAVREKASAELVKMGQAAHPALRKALESESPEVRRRAANLLEQKGEAPPLSPEELRAMRIVEVMQKIGTPATRPALVRLAAGSPARRSPRWPTPPWRSWPNVRPSHPEMSFFKEEAACYWHRPLSRTWPCC